MPDTSRKPVPAPTDAPLDTPVDPPAEIPQVAVLPVGGTGAEPAAEEPRGCLFALSQPPLMIFLAVIGALLLAAAVHDLFVL
ncbi:hypothetical protein [Streptomyces sp. NPDC058855]|uniref:hypothetical protein n=1 Tax=Streptomyces sp. NPDC058855 TaxID=3346651 RepID=UPI0036B0E8AD